MPLVQICARGIPIIYYQRKILLTPYRFAYNIFIPTFLLWHEIGWGGDRRQSVPNSLYQLYNLIIRKQHRACLFLYLEGYGVAASLWA